AAEGGFTTPLLCTFGLTLIGSASLYRAYQTTVRLYKGQFTSDVRRQPITRRVRPVSDNPALLERSLPWTSESVSAVALAGIRSLTRAPEAKMLLLTPIILAFIFGAAVLRNSAAIPEGARPLLALAAVTVTTLTMSQFVGNQFGFDRSGFRVFILSP